VLAVSRKAQRFTESVIREMTRLCRQHDAVNLAQGFPDFAAPREIKDAACRAIEADVNQYAITWGAKSLRDAIAAKTERLYGVPVDPEREIAVTCGATEAMIASILAIVDPGDEVVVFEPFYENYGPDAILAGACWAAYIVLGGRVSRVLPSGPAVALGLSVAAVAVLPFSLADGGLAHLTPSLLVAGAAMAILSSALPFTLEMRALGAMPARTFSILMSLEPAVAAVCGLFLLRERLTGTQWMAVALVIAASAGSTATARRVPLHVEC
jgi:hypothetical protein